MHRSIWLMAAMLIVVTAADGFAAGADPGMSDIPNVLVVPGGGLPYRITLRDASGHACPLVTVDLVWPGAVPEVCYCPGTPMPVISAVTDTAGVATFDIAAGGCLDPDGPSGGIEVRADGLPVTVVGQVSPDLSLPGGEPFPDCMVGLADAVTAATSIRDSNYTFCSDFNSDGAVGLTDGVLIAPFIKRASTCP